MSITKTKKSEMIKEYSVSEKDNGGSAASKVAVLTERIRNLKENMKNKLKAISNDNSGQGAAEYILLFGGVIVIALAGLLIYRSYFSNNASGLNATQDISSIRNNVTSIY